MNRPLKLISIVLGMIAVVLVGVLIFWTPARGPTTTAGDMSGTQVVLSPDGNIRVTSPTLNAVISSPVSVSGQAIHDWYFEASFPVKVLDGNGAVLGQGPAQAQGDWMTTGTVPFTASIPFKAPKYATGTIVFMSDNPSGDPARQKSFRFPVRFK